MSNDSIFNPTPRPLVVLVVFGKLLGNKPLQPGATDWTKLYQNGDTSIGPLSTPLDALKAFNKDWFKIYKVFQHKIGYSAAGQTGANAANQHFANNDFKLNIVNKVNLTKMCPKTLKFNDTTNQPTNDGLYMWAYTFNADGTFTSNSRPCQMFISNTYVYEDA